MRSFKKYLISLILILAVIGVSYELMTNPVGFLTRVFVGIGVLTVLVLLVRYIMAKRSGLTSFSPQTHSQRPTRAQLTKAKQTSHTTKKNKSPLSMLKRNEGHGKPSRRAINRKDAHHLTVIEGKKNKKKNRALF